MLDALKDPVDGYYDPRDPYTTVPRSSVLGTPYASHARRPARAARSNGMRLGVIRESMLIPPGSKTEVPIVTAAAREIKAVLGEQLGATLVESADPLWKPDPRHRADDRPISAARWRGWCRSSCPTCCSGSDPDGQPVFKEFAAAIVPTEFMPGKIVRHRHDAADRLLRRAGRRTDRAAGEPRHRHHPAAGAGDDVPLPHPAVPDAPRADWQRAGFTETLVDLAALNARSKFWGDDQRAAFRNWEEVTDPRNPLGGRQGVDERIMLRELLRRVDMMVILENRLDALVRLHTPWPPAKIGGAYQYDIASNLAPESLSGPNAGLTEVLIPAGYVTTVYDPVFALSADGTRYVSRPSHTPTTIPAPGLPFSLVFRAEPGKEDVLLKIASAYEAASKRRIPPPAFGPIADSV